ncbi:ScbA/BarX family gamma-butyrolactone biosynthesis protein [Streptomyces sp. MP131-18]|uniref:ScbA/BarX family gamma-butyrolactone biosynthesis protein n=1 Tax=Streptomyces sp. MP131-18 TaxID=1857892 RepID=UPI0009CE4B8B|nr:ScbA/BarX family gamma-butyrolactone biosynthesis protein [Streptomyces sp. MP131-18]ONK09789.1 A-factor biosynthesis hotdog domain protein [Streptomyces sp. MP131-18]
MPREYVHLVHEDTVFITGWKRLKTHKFLLTAVWPGSAGIRPYDPRVLSQLIRQSGLAIAHAEYDVPLAYQTLLHSLDYDVAEGLSLPDDRPTPLEIEVVVAEAGRKGRTARSLTMEVRLRAHGATVVTSRSEFGWVSPAVYRRLRGGRSTAAWGAWPLPAALAPESVGRAALADVVLSPGLRPHHWQLRNDVANTLLFDHPVDHVPGLVLVEAALQAAQTRLPGFAVRTVRSSYQRFAELDEPCWIEVRPAGPPGPDGADTLLVGGTQDGRPVFDIALGGTVRRTVSHP